MCGIKGQKWIKKENKDKVKEEEKLKIGYKPYKEWEEDLLGYDIYKGNVKAVNCW